MFFAGVAQLVEQLTCNQPVGGSTPFASSRRAVCSLEFLVRSSELTKNYKL